VKVLLSADDPWIRWDWVDTHVPDVLARLTEHIELTVIAVVLGLVIALPLAAVATRWHSLLAPILTTSGILYTIPSLALFALLVPLTGLTVLTSEIGLVSYTLLILIRNTAVGLAEVPADVIESAQGMGYRPFALLVRIEFPLAIPSILAGLRIATVTTIGLVTVTALIGQGGLGQLINDGLQRDFKTPLVVGTALSVALALVADLGLAGLQRVITPWARRER
jgi:osmoprotectant transport system permease protein